MTELRAGWALVADAVPRRLGAGLALLSVAVAASEGIGLVLLVPMLGVLSPAPDGSALGARLAAFGLPVALEPLLMLFVALVTLRSVVALARDVVALRFEAALVDGLRNRTWRALLHCEWRELAGLRHSDSASLLITNIDQIGHGMNRLLVLVGAVLNLAAVAVVGLLVSPALAAIAAIGGALVLAGYRGLRSGAATIGVALQRAYQAVYAALTEGLEALRIIKIYRREGRSEREVAEAFAAVRAAQEAFVRNAGLARLILHAGGALVLALAVLVAVRRLGLGPATILPVVVLVVRTVPLLGTVQECLAAWRHAGAARTATAALLGELEQHREPACTGGAGPRLEGAVALEGVTLRLAGRDEPALRDLSLILPPGTTTLVTGPSGSGKSTLADVLAGLLAPDSGALRVGPHRLDGPLRQSWRDQVAYIQQEPLLFHASVRDNLAWAAPEASEAQLVAALDAASARFAMDLPQGLDTVVGWRGSMLSGGERQRIALARGLLRHPDLLILDEVTSALDPASEAAVVRAVAGLRGRMTIVIISHRGALADLADREIRLENGSIMATCDTPGS